MALLLRMMARDEDARAFYAEHIAAHPDWVALLDDAILWDLQVGRIDVAFARCRAAVDEPTLDDAQRLYVMRRLSLLELEYGNTQAGVDLIRETLEIDPDNPAARQHLAGGLLKLGQVDEAVTVLEEAVDRFPENANLLAALAEVLDSLGRSEEAAAIRARAEALHAERAH
jgi:predicted Zn-dependent protease